MDSHAEVRAMHRRNSLRCSAHFDLRYSLAPENVEEEFARRTAESSRRFAWLNRHPLVGSGPLDLEAGSVKPPTQEVAAAANVSPQGRIHWRREATGPLPIGSAKVLVVNKELVQIRQGADPSDAEEPDGRARPDPRDEPFEIPDLGQPGPTPLGETFEGTGENDARPGNEIAFAQHDVGGEVVSSPALEQCWNGRAELVEEITELKALSHI